MCIYINKEYSNNAHSISFIIQRQIPNSVGSESSQLGRTTAVDIKANQKCDFCFTSKILNTANLNCRPIVRIEDNKL